MRYLRHVCIGLGMLIFHVDADYVRAYGRK
jgi:hypothetical protein